MEPSGTVRGKITTSMWLGFVAVLLILGVTLLIYTWQFQQTSHRVVLMTGTQQPLQQATWEMRQSNADIARYVADYALDPERDYIQRLRDAEIAFDRAELKFNELAQSDEVRSLSQDISGIYGNLRKSADDVLSLVDSQQAALLSARETAKEAASLMQGMFTATIDDSSQASTGKLRIVLDMRHSLETITTDIEAYVQRPAPAIRQQMLNSGEDFKRLSASFQNLTLSSLESSWLQHMEDQVEKLLSDGTTIFTTTDSLVSAIIQFQASVNGMETILTERVQPVVNTEALMASQALQNSVASAGGWLIALAITAVVIGIMAVLMVSRQITGPMHQLLSGIGLVASGRIEYRFNADAKGEFGQLALGLNKMLDNLKRSSEALRESEELSWALLDATHDAVVLIDLRGTILASNEIAASRFSRSLEQMVDESLYDLLPVESAASLKARVTEIIRTKKHVHYEDEREGKIIEHDIYPVSEHKGEVSRIAFFFRDVTMSKWVEDVTEQLGRRNALILESAGEGIFGLDVEGRTTFVNPTAARIHGYKPEELIDKKHHDLVHHSRPDGKPYPHDKCPIHATIKDGTVNSNVDNEVFWRKDGTAFQVEYTSTPIIENGRILGAVITFRDIGDRKRVEKALRESEEKYRSVVESSASLIIWLDQEGMIADCSPLVDRFLGHTPADIIGRPFLELVHQQDLSRVEEALSVTAKEGFKHDHHFRMVLKRGGSIEVSMHTAITGDIKGGYARTICMINTISQQVFNRHWRPG
ncbi:PAS domain S-box protein [Chloroflexota bacterium]